MPHSARCCAFLLPLLASPAFAQADGAMPRPILPRALAQERRAPLEFRIPAGQVHGRRAVASLSAAMSVGDGMQLGVGRFSVLELAQPRTHMASEPQRRQTSIAAVRLSFSF